MSRYLLVSLFALAASSSADAIVPPIPSGLVVPFVPEAKPEAKPDGEEAEDVAKLADRIGKNAKTVTDKLGEQDTGDATRKDQKQLKQDLDKLIDLLQNQPPPPMSNDSSQQPPPPSGGQKPPPMGGPQPMGNKPRGGSGRQKPPPMGGQQPMPMGGQQPMPMGAKPGDMGQPMGGQQPMDAKGGNEAGKGGAATPTLPLAETIAKDFWGHLPEQPRQRMMQFFREQYNSRYKNLLPDYFSTLAEKEKKGKK